MTLPNGLDAIDLLYAVNGMCLNESLQSIGLNRTSYRNAKKAQGWFWGELVMAMVDRKKRFDRKKRLKK
jgi:hypothetical protein